MRETDRLRAEADAARIRSFFAVNNVSFFVAANELGMSSDRVRMIAKKYGIQAGLRSERGIGAPKVAQPVEPNVWHRIAWRWNDRMSPWRECDDAPIGLDAVRTLCGLAPRSSAQPGHVCAQRTEGARTVLVYRVAK